MATQIRDFSPQTASLSLSTTFPTYEIIDANNATSTVVLSTVAIGLVIFVPNIFGESGDARSLSRRSIQEDQRDLFSQIEEGLTAAGIDGHACVLRFICEMQTNAFSPSSIFGEVFNLVFTPKPGGDSSVLEEYIKAKATGQDYGESGEAAEERGPPMCAQRYASCPMSVFSYLKRLRGSHRDHAAPEDRPGG
ncbi:uncharacterized protein LOC127003166 isoform X2 [Eriocheir sinensis]|uniref:uncharacterized protein LOC127003166 isoform X2 n=1 Tax=Eriocheir sinensis TaxID=95602 RepID=UPI0021C8D03F|nr:uncharacterized protein LOC127003166 isoform X2 [Eriocheir sinensis]